MSWASKFRPRLSPETTAIGALLKLNGVELMLNTAYEAGQRPSVPDPTRMAAHSDTILFFGCKDLDAAYLHLRAHGLPVKEPKIAPYGMKQLYVTDRDGYGNLFSVAFHAADVRSVGRRLRA